MSLGPTQKRLQAQGLPGAQSPERADSLAHQRKLDSFYSATGALLLRIN